MQSKTSRTKQKTRADSWCPVNWYKAATEVTVPITPERFRAMTFQQKVKLANTSASSLTQALFLTEEYERKSVVLRALAWSENIHPEVQTLFFTEEYGGKDYILSWLADNRSIHSATQRLFFKHEYVGNHWVFVFLARNESIIPDVQRLFFAGEYKRKSEALYNLAWNRSITPEVQRLFFTELYGGKANILSHLVDNPMFLHDFTLEELLLIRNVVRGAGKLHVLSKRLGQIAGVP